ncbi:1852_t:CDS:2 [Funneliformis caledonium]|uniref:1852_t:CDS:1 n=1 Tax=Funneliformis caledonium TaxID=1117310 RepID=A0A9N9CB14_9GLOM|nr:1852_t:CDS:2 [Funneliformis caledonium]
MKKFIIREWAELISVPITLNEQSQQVFEHADLPEVNDELSVTLRLKLQSHSSSWAIIFHKGTEPFIRTPRLVLLPNKSSLHARFTGNWTNNAGIYELGDGLLLNKWYHIAYTLSDSKKRLDIYIDGQWFGFYGIQNVTTENVVFNEGPLYIGRSFDNGFNGEICNFRYFNWRLRAEEVKEDFINKLIENGSKVALVHVLTKKYLTTKGIRYPKGQVMAVCNGQELDLKNDVFTVIEAHGTSVNAGSPVPFNTTIGFKHQATKAFLHSHNFNSGCTSITNHLQVTIWDGRDGNDDWVIRRYGSKDNSGYLSNGDIISLHHVLNDRSLYSHPVLLDDGTQEVSCHGNGNVENNKWRIELIDDSKI